MTGRRPLRAGLTLGLALVILGDGPDDFDRRLDGGVRVAGFALGVFTASWAFPSGAAGTGATGAVAGADSGTTAWLQASRRAPLVGARPKGSTASGRSGLAFVQ